MKTSIQSISLIVVLFMLMTSCAASVAVRPRQPRQVTVVKATPRVIVPRHPRVAVYKNVNYYRNQGVWYVMRNRKYVTVAAPIGAQVATLPRGYRKVRRRGITYYRCKGVYYRRAGRKYVVVRV